MQDSEAVTKQIEAFRQKIKILEDENRKIKECGNANGLSVLVKLRQRLLLVQNLTSEAEPLESRFYSPDGADKSGVEGRGAFGMAGTVEPAFCRAG